MATSTDNNNSKVGILVVGLGGANGTTMLAGVIANRNNVQWRGSKGEHMGPNYYGCITQLNQRGVHGGVGYKDKIQSGLADANCAAIGGWDIRPTKPGDALLEAQILDYDLVRQVKDEMNEIEVLPAVYDPRFIGSSQHETATHVLSSTAPTMSDSEKLEKLRDDVRRFQSKNGLAVASSGGGGGGGGGHTTMIWSASVESNCEYLLSLRTAKALLNAINEQTEQEEGEGGKGDGRPPLPPSILYAAAAVLEGCSFINGGSQNTLSCPGLIDLANRQQPRVYCLGTDFKAGQTKFKTAAVEYLRTMGLKPRVIASSNHLGNNDMRNLASSATTTKAKLRVKHDIFAPWEEDDLDHKVSIMFTPFINDEKRDFVEYTSLGFLGQVHTMMTYTRASDSVLCVPLMLDGAVWCDYFSRKNWPNDKVAKALAYLFKVPEGAAQGVDPGFFLQMKELDREALEADQIEVFVDPGGRGGGSSSGERQDTAAAEWSIPNDDGGSSKIIICAGLACLDMQLNHATSEGTGESIETFEGVTSIGGGSVSMACKTLARLSFSDSPVVSSVVPLCKIGTDDSGNKLISLLEACGGSAAAGRHNNVETKFVEMARAKDPNARTSLSVLPIYQDGRRGCFFDAASNNTFSADDLVKMIDLLSPSSTGAFQFGYPHLLPMLQGGSLAKVYTKARQAMVGGGITVLDLNGVQGGSFEIESGTGLRSVASLQSDPVLGAALQHVDILHMNEEELMLLTGCKSTDDDEAIAGAVNLFLLCGVAVVALTRGSKGSYVRCNGADRFRDTENALPASWAGGAAKAPCFELPKETVLNVNGAGDSYTAGLLVAAMLRSRSDPSSAMELEYAAKFAGLVAAYHIDVGTRDLDDVDIKKLLDLAKA